MYSVSNAYKTAVKKPSIRTRVSGFVGEVPFDDSNIVLNSLSITNQNSGNDSVQIGTVYIGELNITLRGLELERYSLNDKKITANFELKTGINTWEKVPLGEYYVGEANHTALGLEIKAYDVIGKFDKKFRGEVFSSKPYGLVNYACEQCGVELKNTQEEFELFANGNEILALWQEGADIETWRDFISWVAQACCCYATASRDGKLLFRTYNTTVIDTLDASNRFVGASFSDYETRYTGIYVTNMNDNIMNYYGAEVDDGLTYSLGSNPFLQFGDDTVKERIRRAVLERLAAIDYVPFEVEVAENPAYDLGDVLSFPNGLGDADKLFCINKYIWNYHKGIKISGVGENPALTSAQSKSDKNISGILSKIDTTKTVVYNFINLDPINVGSTLTEILSIDYFAKDVTSAMFLAEILIEVSANDISSQVNGTAHYVEGEIDVEKNVTFDFIKKAHPILTVTYKSNDIAVSDFIPEQILHEGKQIITLFFPLPLIEQNSSNNFSVFLSISDGSGAIEERHVRATISGQGLVSETAEWNGRIRLDDTVSKIAIDGFDFSIKNISDTVTVTQEVPTPSVIAESVSKIAFDGFSVTVKGLTGTVNVDTE